jgi:hypothetical protein
MSQTTSLIMTRTATLSNIHEFTPGTVLRINRGLYDHVALLGEHDWPGERQVLSFGPSLLGLEEVSFSEFAGKRVVRVDGFLGQLTPTEVLARARGIGVQRRYSWLAFNCEHFVRAAHGSPLESPQLGRAFLLAIGTLILQSGHA